MLETTGHGRERLRQALMLAPVDRVTGVLWRGNALVILYEHGTVSVRRMTFAPELMTDLVIDWLGRGEGSNPSYPAPQWDREPDIDGSCEKGWRLVSDDDEIVIHPHWMIYHT